MNEYRTYWLAAHISRMLPEKLAYWIGLRVADRFYAKNHKGREAIVANLRQIYSGLGVVPAGETLQGLARKTFQYFGKYLVDFFRYARLTPEDVSRRVSVERKEYLDQALAYGKGVLVVTAHLGNWELGGAVISAMGYQLNALVLPARLEKLERLFKNQREKRGMRLIPVGHSVFSIIRCLRENQLVAVLGDRDFTGKDDRIPFFGQPARIPRGPAWLSAKTGAPVVPAFLLRQVDDTFLIRFYPPIWPEQEKDAEAIRAKIARVLEQEIGAHPYQWFIFDPFWANHDTVHDRKESAP